MEATRCWKKSWKWSRNDRMELEKHKAAFNEIKFEKYVFNFIKKYVFGDLKTHWEGWWIQGFSWMRIRSLIRPLWLPSRASAAPSPSIPITWKCTSSQGESISLHKWWRGGGGASESIAHPVPLKVEPLVQARGREIALKYASGLEYRIPHAVFMAAGGEDDCAVPSLRKIRDEMFPPDS